MLSIFTSKSNLFDHPNCVCCSYHIHPKMQASTKTNITLKYNGSTADSSRNDSKMKGETCRLFKIIKQVQTESALYLQMGLQV